MQIAEVNTSVKNNGKCPVQPLSVLVMLILIFYVFSCFFLYVANSAGVQLPVWAHFSNNQHSNNAQCDPCWATRL